MQDSFYTSTLLACQLTNYVDENKNIRNVADFCVGDGELLRAAQSKWNNLKCYGLDISSDVIKQLKVVHPEWKVGICDFLNEDKIKNCKIIKNKKFDLILLNPPFTCKGSSINKVQYKNDFYNVSTAMTFLLNAINYLHKNGVLIAILPISTAYSMKDRKIWQRLESDYNLKILEERNKQSFKKCNPNIVIISINDWRKPNIKKQELFTLNVPDISLFRGNLSVNDSDKYICKGGLKYIHTTNLINNEVLNTSKYISYPKSEVCGPAVLLPRVGNPSVKKISILRANEKCVLSDCIIAIKTKSEKESLRLKESLIKNWESLQNIYKGTGARYTTLERLSLFLGKNV